MGPKAGIERLLATFLCCALMASFVHVHGAHLDETEGSGVDETTQAEPTQADKFSPTKYLKAYGYLTYDESETPENLAQALKVFQKFVSIPVTGNMTDETRQWMQKGRCGNKDITVPKSQLAEMRQGTERDPYEVVEETSFEEDTRLTRRHAVTNPTVINKWSANKTITYRLANSPSSLQARYVEADVKAAFQAWAQASGLRFSEIDGTGKADIEVKFVKDYEPAEEHALAEARELNQADDAATAQVQLSDNTIWSTAQSEEDGAGGANSKRLMPVLLHELGHALGLPHSHLKESVMFPVVGEQSELSKSDKSAVEAIYQTAKKSELREANAICDRYPFIYDYTSPGPNFRTYYSCTRAGPILRYCPIGLAFFQRYGYCDYAFNIPGFSY